MSHPFAALDGYELRNLVENLTENRQLADLIWLLEHDFVESTQVVERRTRSGLPRSQQRRATYTITRAAERRHQAWYAARIGVSELSSIAKDIQLPFDVWSKTGLNGFIRDIQLTYDLWYELGTGADTAAERGAAVGSQQYYALLTASVGSLATGIPPSLVGLLVAHDIWTATQSLQYIQRISDEEQQASAIIAVASHIPDNLIEQLITTVRQIEKPTHRARVLPELAQWMSAQQREALLDTALSLPYNGLIDNSRADALVGLVPHLPQDRLFRVLEALPKIYNDYDQERLLIALAPRLPEALLDEALSLVNEQLSLYGDREYHVLATLAPYIARHGDPEAAIQAVEEIYDEEWRALALARIACHCAEPLYSTLAQRVVGMAQHTGWVDFTTTVDAHYHRILDQPQEGAVEMAFVNRFRPEVMVELLAFLPDDLFEQAVAQVLDRWDPYNGAWLVPRMVGMLPESRKTFVLRKAIEYLHHYRQGTDTPAPFHRAKALAELAKLIPQTLAEMALDAVRDTEDPDYQTRILIALVPQLPAVLVAEAIAIVEAIDPKLYLRLDALAALTPYLNELQLEEILSLATQAEDAERRAKWLIKIAPQLSEDLQRDTWQEVLAAIQEISYKRAERLTELVPQLPDNLRPDVLREALAAAQTIDDRRNRVRVQLLLVPHLSEARQQAVLPQILEAANATFRHSRRVSIAADMLQSERETTLQPLLPIFATHGYAKEALAMVQERQQETQALAFARLVPYLPEPTRQQTLWRSFAMARATGQLAAWAQILFTAPMPMPAQLIQMVPTLLKDVPDDGNRADLLAVVAPILPTDVHPQVLAVAQAIRTSSARAVALAALAGVLAEPEKSRLVQELRTLVTPQLDTQRLVQLLQWLPPSRAEELLAQHLVNFWGKLESRDKLAALRLLAPHLPPAVQTQALMLIEEMSSPATCSIALAILAPHLDAALQATTVRRVLDAIAKMEPSDEVTKAQALVELVPSLSAHEQTQVARQIFDVLLSLRQRIEAKEPAPLIDEIVQRLARIPAVVLYPAWSDALKQASSQPRIRLLDIIADWMPVLVALGGATAADETFQAIDNVSHWWP